LILYRLQKVARAGIEPATRGFSIPASSQKTLIYQWVIFANWLIFGKFLHNSGNSGTILPMARIAKIKVQDTEKGWLVNVPASCSNESTRQRRYFKTRELAQAFASSLRDKIKDHGVQSITLPASLTMDALKAQTIMQRFEGVTLAQAAQFYAKHHDAAAKCPTVAIAFTESIDRRRDMSAAYLSDMRSLERRLPESFKGMNIYEVTGRDVALALDHATGGTTMWRNAYRTIRAIFGDQVKSGTIKTNPCANVHQPKVKKADEVTIYTPAQCRAIFDACRVYQDGISRDCRDCVAAFAVLIFAGIRPIEITRLTWDNVNLQTGFIRLSGAVTKTGRTRNAHISKTLRAWLETVPEDRREGKIIPNDWRRKSARVRKSAGIDGREYQDAARHTFGSFTVTLEGIEYVRSVMGHGFTATFERHYLNALTIPQAKAYTDVLPPTEAITAGKTVA
jgi:integrase